MHRKHALATPAGISASDEIGALRRQLELAGAECLISLSDTLELQAPEIPGTAVNRLLEAATESRPVSITVGFGDQRAKERQLKMLCLRLQQFTPGGPLTGLVVDARDVRPVFAWSLRQKYLGDGPLAVVVDQGTPERDWRELWQLRAQPFVTVVLPSRVRSPCSLLAPELARAVTLERGLRVPASTAWVQLRLSLEHFSDAAGVLQREALDGALACCVETGDRLHDLLPWRCGAMRHDAWFNRRLAIEIGGLANIARLRGLDPDCRADVAELDMDLRHVRKTLQERSLQLAKQRGVLPSIEQTDPVRRLPVGAARDDWHMRWRRAVSGMSYRHRALLAMAPWCAVSPGKTADFSYANLLPLLAEADVVAFRRSASIEHWNFNKFREFYGRTWAVLQQKNAAPVFAERL